MSIFPYRIYFENLNTDLNLFFCEAYFWYIWMNQCAVLLRLPFHCFLALFSFYFSLLNSGILWKPQGFWIWEGQPFISEEKGNLIENRGYFWFFQRNFSSPSFYLPSDGILLGSSEPTVRWLASAAQIFFKYCPRTNTLPQRQWLSCLETVFWLI